ncbi:PDZ domain-containing protein 8-like [Ptychodera flava]|uniref:PDZ domain-containing protein 8-like n=1 Tax=Ptychodera flava TaxID=63121 RepID=UPI00396A4C67
MLLVILVSMIVGCMCTIVLQIIMFYSYIRNQPFVGVARRPQYERAQMPKELGKYQDMVAKKESLNCLNFAFAFLFGELKDTERVRQWIVKKMNVEFDELLQTKTLGRVIEALTVRDYSLGTALPVFKNATLLKAKPSDMEQVPEEIDISLEVEYNGGFRLAVDADLVFGRTAFVSITLKHLQGKGRLQFTRHPYTHWSFAFYTEPEMDFEVESQFEGRIVSQLGSLIVNQIRRSIRKKHTLPNYKIRYKPFFIKPDPPHLIDDVLVNDMKVTVGRLQVTVVECSRLPPLPAESEVFCTVAVDSSPYKQKRSSNKTMKIPYDTVEVEIQRSSQSQPLGTSFKQDIIGEDTDELVILDSVTQNSPASSTDLKKGDVLVSIDGGKVTSVKQAAKLVKQAGEKVMMKVRRPHVTLPDDGSFSETIQNQTMYAEESVNLRSDNDAKQQDNKEDDDYVNITIKKIDSTSTIDSQAVASASINAPDIEDGNAKQKATSSPMLIKRKLQTAVGAGVRAFSGKGDDGKSTDCKPVKNDVIKTEDSEIIKESKRKSSLEVPSGDGNEVISKKECDQNKLDSTLQVTDNAENLSRRGSTQSLKDVVGDADCLESSKDIADGASLSSLMTKLEDLNDIETRMTSHVPAMLDPAWDETFQFDVFESDQYLHVCVWCKGFIPAKPDKETLISFTSVPLMNVALQCLTTASGELLQTFHLQPPERRAGSSRRGLHPELAAHRGFDERLCYGDVTLLFHHLPDPALQNQIKEEMEVKIQTHSSPEVERQPKKSTTSVSSYQNKITQDACTSTKKIPAPQDTFEKKEQAANSTPQAAEIRRTDEHDWIGTQFYSPTRCDFCTKKVWTKYAFQCRVCAMICHKKCQEKAQLHTYCTKQGPRRSSTSKPLVDANKSLKDDTSVKVGTNAPPVSTKPAKSSKLLPRALHLTSRLPHRGQSSKGATMPDVISDTEGSDSDSLTGNARSLKTQLLQTCGPRTKPGDADALVVSAAKEMGKELFSHLEIHERKEKLDAMISKLQQEIDQESESRTDLFKEEKQCTDVKEKARLNTQINKSDERLQALALLMLHYCAGLHDCTEQEEREKLKSELATKREDQKDVEGQVSPEQHEEEQITERGEISSFGEEAKENEVANGSEETVSQDRNRVKNVESSDSELDEEDQDRIDRTQTDEDNMTEYRNPIDRESPTEGMQDCIQTAVETFLDEDEEGVDDEDREVDEEEDGEEEEEEEEKEEEEEGVEDVFSDELVEEENELSVSLTERTAKGDANRDADDKDENVGKLSDDTEFGKSED